MFISVIDTTERVSSFLPSPKLREKERKKRKEKKGTLHRDFHLSFSLETEYLSRSDVWKTLYTVSSASLPTGNVSKH